MRFLRRIGRLVRDRYTGFPPTDWPPEGLLLEASCHGSSVRRSSAELRVKCSAGKRPIEGAHRRDACPSRGTPTPLATFPRFWRSATSLRNSCETWRRRCGSDHLRTRSPDRLPRARHSLGNLISLGRDKLFQGPMTAINSVQAGSRDQNGDVHDCGDPATRSTRLRRPELWVSPSASESRCWFCCAEPGHRGRSEPVATPGRLDGPRFPRVSPYLGC